MTRAAPIHAGFFTRWSSLPSRTPRRGLKTCRNPLLADFLDPRMLAGSIHGHQIFIEEIGEIDVVAVFQALDHVHDVVGRMVSDVPSVAKNDVIVTLAVLFDEVTDIFDAVDADLTLEGLAILAETGLSFLGFGVQPPDVSLGTLIADGTKSVTTFPWVFLFPAGVLVTIVLCANLIGDGLRDAIDPGSATLRRLRGGR